MRRSPTFLDETDVNLRLIERGWSIHFEPEAEVHHYLPGRTKSGTRTPSAALAATSPPGRRPISAGSTASSALSGGHRRASGRLPRATQAVHRAVLADRAIVLDRCAARLRLEADQGLADGARSAAEPFRSITARTSTPPASPAPPRRVRRADASAGSRCGTSRLQRCANSQALDTR